MTVTSIDIDPTDLTTARRLVGASSNKETVDLALKTLIAIRSQAAVVSRIIGREFADDQIDAPTIEPSGADARDS